MTLLLICKTSEKTTPLQYDQTWEIIKIIIINAPLVSPFVFSIFDDIIHSNEVPIKKEPVNAEEGHNTKRISVEDHAAMQKGVAKYQQNKMADGTSKLRLSRMRSSMRWDRK